MTRVIAALLFGGLACVGAWRWSWLSTEASQPSWRAPESCVEVYELRIDEAFRDASVASFVGREPEHATWWLALAQRDTGIVAVLLADDPDEPPRRRALWWSSRAIGPAAPDFACRRRSWDPLEDALALGWPTLPAGRVSVGDAWVGSAVEGRCHETVCLSDDGRFTHERPCRARPWRERLAGADNGLMLIAGDWDDGQWDDGHDPETGILTSRLALLDDGRPLQVWAGVAHHWSGVRRSLSLTRIDDCGRRSLARPEHAPQLARARAALDAS